MKKNESVETSDVPKLKISGEAQVKIAFTELNYKEILRIGEIVEKLKQEDSSDFKEKVALQRKLFRLSSKVLHSLNLLETALKTNQEFILDADGDVELRKHEPSSNKLTVEQANQYFESIISHFRSVIPMQLMPISLDSSSELNLGHGALDSDTKLPRQSDYGVNYNLRLQPEPKMIQ